MNVISVVASNTIKEILRDRILYGLILFAALLLLVALLLSSLTFVEQERVVTDLGLVGVEIGCCMLAIFVGSSLVWREMEKQTVLLLISKPVKRSHFLFGKFIGLGAVLILVDILISLFLAMMCKLYGHVYWPQFVLCQLGILLESLILLSTSLFFGVFCRPTLTTLFTLSVWIVGHGINSLHYFSGRSHNAFTRDFGLAVSRVFPNLDYLNFKEAVLYGDPISAISIERAVAICAAWVMILLISSTVIFNRRDFI